ncbi:MAG TPA: pitrilysin family protein [Candidatus Saccharimonadia bacterium]|nr:pitrilysin family protein [Candidatus Saccharimonadia bacterium]
MKIQQTTLKNGLRIITAQLADARSLTVNIAVGTGSRYEEFAVNGGVSHFLEHLLFKGTAKYPSAQIIAEAIDAVGGYSNAYTSEDMTSYYIKVPGAHGDLALDILADMVKSPLIEADEVDRERGVIIEEMNVWRDDPARFISTLLPELIFPDNPLGQDIIGPEEVINRVPVADIKAYQRRMYRPGNMVVAAAGRVDHERVVARMQAALGELEAHAMPTFKPVSAKLADSLTVVHAKPTAQAHFMIGARGYAYDHPNDDAAQVLSVILGRGMSSRLFLNVRERQGLAYTVFAETNNYVDTGVFHAYAGVNLDKVPQALDAVMHELELVRREPVAEAELRKAQQQIRAGIEMGLESNGTVADSLATQLVLLGRVKSVEQAIAEVEAVTVADVQRVAHEMLAPERLRFAIIAPEPEAAAEHFRSLVSKKENV